MTDPDDIVHWRRLDARITTSGQPSEDQLAALKALGVTTVINLGLHSHEKALPDETASVARLGMDYVYLPVDFDRPTEADFDQFCAVMNRLDDEPVHIHCIANYRVSAFLYRWLRDVKRVPEDEARWMMDTLWQPGGAWAAFIGDKASSALPHRPPLLPPPGSSA